MTRRQFLRAIALSLAATFAGKPLLAGLLQLLERAMAWIEAQRVAAAAAARMAMITAQLRYQSLKMIEELGRAMVMQYRGTSEHWVYYDPACLEKMKLADAYGVVTDVDHHAGEITVDFSGRPPAPRLWEEWDDYLEDPNDPPAYRSSISFDFKAR